MKRKNEKQKPTRRSRKPVSHDAQTETETQIESVTSNGNDAGNSGDSADTVSENSRPEETQAETAQKELSEAENDLLDVEKMLSNFANRPPADPPEAETPDTGSEGKRKYTSRKKKGDEPERAPVLIPGKLFVSVCDNIVVGAIGIVDGYLYPKLRLDTRYLKLTDQQRDELAPLAEEALRMMPFIDDPRIAFFGSLIASHVLNYVNLRNTLAAEMRAQPQGK